METEIAAKELKQKNKISVILWTGLLVGTLDISAAIINYTLSYQKNPVRVFQFIASGVFGKEAFSGNSSMIFYGIIFHYLIAFTFTIFFFFIYPKINFLLKNIVITSIIYGVFIWIIMNLVIVPISNTPKFPFNLFHAIINMIILIAAIGLPLAYSAKKFYFILRVS
ncbi:MAG: hypothetical protein ACR2FN_09600 [Chitinophagaceae bacterium]